jgi:ABC-type antimicrobial peptide transport system permease subunit
LAQLGDDVYPWLFVRASGDAASLVAPLRERLQREMPGAAYVNVVPMSTLVDPNLQAWRFGATMFAVFGGLALLLAAIGLYSMIAYEVAQRSREMGVRLALGAPSGRVMRLIVGRGVRTVALGIALGCLIAFWAARWFESLMFRQPARDPAVFAAVAVVLLAVAVIATLVPALRAARIDPNVALRTD